MDNRKEEILKITRKLIQEKGLSNTSTNDIADAVGISRGTLYYHFKTKEEIINELVHFITNQIFYKAKNEAQNGEKDIIKKFFNVINTLRFASNEDSELIENLNSPENIILHQKIQKEMIYNIPLILVPIIEEGIMAKIFNTKYPLESMELLVSYIILILDDEKNINDKQFQANKIKALITYMEKILGTKDGLLFHYMNF